MSIFEAYDAQDNVNLRVERGHIEIGHGAIGQVSGEFHTGVKAVAEIAAALLDIPVIKPFDKVNGHNVVPVKVVNSVEVSENSDPARLRRIAIDHLVAANTAEKMIADGEKRRAKIVEEEAKEKSLEEARKLAADLDAHADTLFGKAYRNLSPSKRAAVEKYNNLSYELETIKFDFGV